MCLSSNCQWLLEGRRSRATISLLHEFLRVYPVGIKTFEELRSLLRLSIQAADTPSLRRWKQRCIDYHLLDEDGDRQFVGRMVAGEASPSDLLQAAGLDRGLDRCRFLELGTEKYLKDASAVLRRGRLNYARLIRLLEWLESDGRLRFETLRVEIARALLEPFIDKGHLYLPIARHPHFGDYSFDIKMDRLLERKRDLNRRVLAPAAATREDMEDLFRSTVEEANDGAVNQYTPGDQLNVDLMEPTAFEEWVLRQLQATGYDVLRTPQTRDEGADGLAIFRAGDGEHTIILQCKHTQSAGNCNRLAIEQVLRSITSYANIIRGEALPMVVTNADGFTKDAKALAEREGVRLVSRDGLLELRKFRPKASE